MSKQGKKDVSGATGGPSNARGVRYQLYYGIHAALELFGHVLAAPQRAFTLTLEPRADGHDALTRWDVSTAPPLRVAELKLAPSRKDVDEWLKRIAGSADRNDETCFLLVYGETSTPLLSAVSSLRRLAIEAGCDANRFLSLCRAEQVRDAEEVIAIFGDGALSYLRRVELLNIPANLLEGNVALRARVLAGRDGSQFVQFLEHRLVQACADRSAIAIQELLQECLKAGIRLTIPAEVRIDDLPESAAGALVLLQDCPSGLPLGVLAESTHSTEVALAAELDSLQGDGIVIQNADRWHLGIPPLTRWTVPFVREVLADGVEALVRYIKENEHSAAGRSLVNDAVNLTRRCYEVNPKAMVRVFRGLEKLLKRIGNKHLVLELSQLTIAAAKLPPRDVEDARAQAQAIICGESWVMQRTGRLDEARVLAQRSLTFGEDISYDRNTAFCMKCTGRILRLQAERLRESEERSGLLAESVGVITAAMERFEIVPEIGSTHPEIGDCYSLLGRTYLVARQFDRAHEAVQKAYELIPPDGSKEHLDLLILTADLQAATAAREAAENTYCEALGLPQATDVQKSEIFARGFFQRGVNRERLGRRQSAIEDYRRAAEIWLELGEFEFAAQAQWAEVRLTSDDDSSVAVIGQEESYLVRVLAYRLLQARFADPAGTVIARRRQPSKQQLEQILKQARADAVIEYPQW